MIAIQVPGSVVTKQTARGYLLRIAQMLLDDLTLESSQVLSEIETRIVNAGFMSWADVETVEMEAMQ